MVQGQHCGIMGLAGLGHSCSTLIWLCTNAPGKRAETWPSVLVPATLVGDGDRVPGSWLPTGPSLCIVAIWGVNK